MQTFSRNVAGNLEAQLPICGCTLQIRNRNGKRGRVGAGTDRGGRGAGRRPRRDEAGGAAGGARAAARGTGRGAGRRRDARGAGGRAGRAGGQARKRSVLGHRAIVNKATAPRPPPPRAGAVRVLRRYEPQQGCRSAGGDTRREMVGVAAAGLQSFLCCCCRCLLSGGARVRAVCVCRRSPHVLAVSNLHNCLGPDAACCEGGRILCQWLPRTSRVETDLLAGDSKALVYCEQGSRLLHVTWDVSPA